MATTAMDYENANGDRFDGNAPSSPCTARFGFFSPPIASSLSDTPRLHKPQRCADTIRTEDAPRYDRDRSASPRRDDGHDSSRRRSMSPNGHDRYVCRSRLTHPSYPQLADD
jgi:hypothetical protein